eukprot:m.114251 g.114251  ORF g.114251 m.114251 type:complete len:528 (-) comp15471_c0_seq2:227-1810(-)
MASNDDDGVCVANQLSAELWARIMLFLAPSDIANLAQVNHRLAAHARDSGVWAAKLRVDYVNHPRGRSITVPTLATVKETYQHLHACHHLHQAYWLPSSGIADHSFARVEGHAMASFDDRYVVLTGGFTNRGITQDVCVVDMADFSQPKGLQCFIKPNDDGSPSSTLEAEKPLRQFDESYFAHHGGQDVYGHTLTHLGNGRFLRYGGCVHGGYYGAVANPVVFDVVVDEESMSATVQLLPTPPHLEHGFGPSCYHSVYPWPNHSNLFVFVGGLVEDTPHAKVAILDVATWSWLEVSLADEELPQPEGRYGFSGGVVDDKLFILGGCTEGDIRRAGEDCRDGWWADLSQIEGVAGGVYTWHSLGTTPPSVWGRETCSVVFGDKIVSFGGSTNSMQADEVTNAVACFDTRTHVFHQPTMYGAKSTAHPATLSAEMVLIRNCLVVYGGWTIRGLLSGPSVLSLEPISAHGMDQEAATSQTDACSMPELEPTVTAGQRHQAFAGNMGMLLQFMFGQMQGDDADDDDEDYHP